MQPFARGTLAVAWQSLARIVVGLAPRRLCNVALCPQSALGDQATKLTCSLWLCTFGCPGDHDGFSGAFPVGVRPEQRSCCCTAKDSWTESVCSLPPSRAVAPVPCASVEAIPLGKMSLPTSTLALHDNSSFAATVSRKADSSILSASTSFVQHCVP